MVKLHQCDRMKSITEMHTEEKNIADGLQKALVQMQERECYYHYLSIQIILTARSSTKAAQKDS